MSFDDHGAQLTADCSTVFLASTGSYGLLCRAIIYITMSIDAACIAGYGLERAGTYLLKNKGNFIPVS